MTTVEIKDKSERKMKIKDIMAGTLFRSKGGGMYVMTDEEDYNGNALAMSITSTSSFGILSHFEDDEEVTKLNGTISVEID